MYKLLNTHFGKFVVRTDENSVTTFAKDSDNTDYQAFLKYQAEGGKVYAADEPIADGE
jgi:hypothetical protein